jgi:type IV fimbrial biogenesis protein FimT
MMVALAVLAVLALSTMPGFRSYLQDCRRNATVHALAHAIHAARQLAGVEGRTVVLCPTRDGEDCSGALDWGGLLILRTEGAAAKLGQRPLRLIQLETARSRQSLRSNRDAIRFTPLTPAATTATLTVCDERGPEAARAVIVSRSGRPRVADRDAAGRLLACP